MRGHGKNTKELQGTVSRIVFFACEAITFTKMGPTSWWQSKSSISITAKNCKDKLTNIDVLKEYNDHCKCTHRRLVSIIAIHAFVTKYAHMDSRYLEQDPLAGPYLSLPNKPCKITERNEKRVPGAFVRDAMVYQPCSIFVMCFERLW